MDSDESASQILKRTFSTKPAVSTISDFASRMQRSAARAGQEQENLRIIGLGTCGSVFETPGTELVYKKGTSEASIWQDYCLTNKVHNATEHVRTMIQEAFPSLTIPKTPACDEFHTANDELFWTENTPRRFPASHRTRQPLFTATRILPLAQTIREALIDLYFDEEDQQEAMNDQDNKDCLVRVYFGERESIRQQTEGYTSLRNFELRLNMMEDLDLEISDLAAEVAIGLAIMHWQAQVDAMDTEFVLGSSPTWNNERQDINPINFKCREVHLWMLDFDKSTAIDLTAEHVRKRLVPAFLGNDPYYPMPKDEALWSEFCSAYLKASEIILSAKGVDKETMTLPQQFLASVLKQVAENESWNPEDEIIFED
ncbi:MAG: hypothetical protein LQ342_002551 [Letrouitia transgressa]|nr:MAG: hypothetical protein LQ342_002551 [Letrouitia transgressa]